MSDEYGTRIGVWIKFDRAGGHLQNVMKIDGVDSEKTTWDRTNRTYSIIAVTLPSMDLDEIIAAIEKLTAVTRTEILQ